MTSGPMIDYEALAQDAMRGVIRAVLTRVAKDSALPGDHHFYISFDTQAAGTSLSKRLKEKYPHEMTIVLQHRFWDLSVADDRFEVKLTFDGIPERLVVPFTAIKVFFDPSVRYGLQFEEPELGPETGPMSDIVGEGKATTTRSAGPRKPRPARKPRVTEKEPAPISAVPAAVQPRPAPEAAPAPAATRPQPVPPAASAGESEKPAPATADAGKSGDDKPAGAQIVSLDAFRKK